MPFSLNETEIKFEHMIQLFKVNSISIITFNVFMELYFKSV